MVADAGLSKHIKVSSAGTMAFHTGERADIRSRKCAQKRGYELRSRARQFSREDFDEFDFIITMDQLNYKSIMALTIETSEEEKVKPFVSFCTQFKNEFSEVPDPYYNESFDLVLDIIEDGCKGLMNQLVEKMNR